MGLIPSAYIATYLASMPDDPIKRLYGADNFKNGISIFNFSSVYSNDLSGVILEKGLEVCPSGDGRHLDRGKLPPKTPAEDFIIDPNAKGCINRHDPSYKVSLWGWELVPPDTSAHLRPCV